MIYLGSNELQNIYIGDTLIQGIYAGETLIYPTTVTAWTVAPDSMAFEKDGGTEKIKIAALDSWTISSNKDWITFSQNVGDSGRTTVIATAAANDASDRTATITVMGDDGYLKTISVSQEAAEYEDQNLTFEILSAGTINWKTTIEPLCLTIEYSKDEGSTWNSITATSAGTSFNVDSGDKVMFRGNNQAYGSLGVGCNLFSGSTAVFKAYGNAMSLINSTDFTGITSGSDCIFNNLFSSCTGLTDASNIILQATSLGIQAYAGMFKDCTSITAAPALPATTFGRECYIGMFDGCTSLTDAPAILPATTLALDCYRGMFKGCTSLTQAPELPAETLPEGCYRSMFQGCTSLTAAPSLPATTLVEYCYADMFRGCTNLNYIKCLAEDISARVSTTNWVSGVAATGTFVKAAGMSDWTTGDNGIPTGWIVEDNYSLPMPFLCNYNAKDYDSATLTIPPTSGQVIESGLTFSNNQRLSAYTEDGYIHIADSPENRISFRFDTPADNPFNRYNTETGRPLTIIYKTSNFFQSIFANRGLSGTVGDVYNYMVRDSFFHTKSSGFLNFTPSTSPYVMYVRVNADGTCERKCVTTGQIATASTIEYGNNPRSCAFFAGGDVEGLGEFYRGDFYWIYIADRALSDSEIQKVIAYNENKE